MMNAAEIQKTIREVPDFPKEGILFYDITTLLQNADAFASTINILAEKYKGEKIDTVIGIESRGFIFGAVLANALGTGFVPVRKKGKLPSQTKSVTYDLEYGSDTLEIHSDAVASGARVLIVDDLLATGGTMQAVARLVSGQGAVIAGIAFVVELDFLKGREKIQQYPVFSIIHY